jgi:outer membrane protein TolC
MVKVFFDTLQYSNKLKLAGFTLQQAEGQAEAMAEMFEDRIATKEDIARLERDIKELKKDLIISVGGMIAGAVTVIPLILKLMNLL